MKHEYLPEGWNLVQLGNVLKKVRRQVDIDPDAEYRQIGIRSHGKGIFHKEPVLGRDLGNKSIFWVKPGDFVLNIVFAWEGAVAVVTDAELGMCGSHRFPTFVVNSDKLELDYLLLHFKSQEGIIQLESVSPGGAGRNKTLSQSDFLRLKIRLPPIEEQRRIVEVMCDIELNITRVEAQITSAQQIKQGVMQQLFSDGLVSDNEHWKRVELIEVCQKPQYGYTESATENPVGPKFLRITDLTDSGVNWETVPYCPISETDFEKYALKSGDIVFARTGATTGKSYLIKDCPPAVFASYLIRVRPKSIDTLYLAQFFNSWIYWSQIEQNKVGSGQPGVNAAILSELIIPYPPIEEQRKIADILNAHDAVIRSLQAEAASLREVKRGLMQGLLSGVLRV